MLNELSLLILGGLMVLALVFPFRQARLTSGLMGLFLGCCLWIGYSHIGNWQAMKQFEIAKVRRAQAEALLASFKSPDDIIQQLRARLDHQPHSAKGWFLLGRLYAMQGRQAEAKAAFLEAKRLTAR